MSSTTNPSAKRIGRELKRQMRRQGLDSTELAKRSQKGVRHLEAVLDGFPNATQRPTQLDTVDQIARQLGLKLALIAD